MKSAKSSLKNAAAIAALSALPVAVSAQSDSASLENKPEFSQSSIEWHFTNGGPDKARLNIFYSLPLKTSGYSFMEFYGKGGYFGKDMLFTPLFPKRGIGVKTETSHALFTNPEGEETSYNKIGFGFEKQGMIPGKIFASIKFLPLVAEKDGIGKTAVLGYYVSKAIPINRNLNINISSFFDVDIAKMIGDYGETDATLEIKTKQGQFDVGVGYNHNVSGKLAPDNQFRARVGYHIKK